jgi:hypothetical protein
MPSAFAVSNSPLTSNGTIAVTGAGTASQYVRGDGSLATFPSLTGFVPYTGATTNVDLGTHRILAQNATIASSGSGDTFTLNHSSGSGIGLNITKGGNGEGLYVNKTGGSGNAATIIGTLNATTLVKSGGTSSQFLKADGSVDSSSYVAGNIYTTNGTLTGDRTLTQGGYNLTFAGGTFSNRFTSAGRLLLGTSDEGTFLLDVNGTARVSNRLTLGEHIAYTASEFNINDSSFTRLRFASGVTQINNQNLQTLTFQGVSFGSPTIKFENLQGGSATADISTLQIFPTYSGLIGTTGRVHSVLELHAIGGPVIGTPGLRYLYINPSTSGFGFTRAIESVSGDVLLGTTSGSVGIGANTTINASAIVDITSITKGVLLPRLTSTQRTAISSPATGLFLYDTTLNSLNVYNGTSWVALGSGGGGGITGSGVAGQVSYWDGTSSQAGSNNLFWDAANSRLGIGTNTPAAPLDIRGNISGVLNGVTVRNLNSLGQSTTVFRAQNDSTGVCEFGLFSSGTTGASAGVAFFYTNQTILDFYANAGNKMRIYGTGNVVIQNGGTFTDSGQRLQVQGTTLLNGNTTISGSTTAASGFARGILINTTLNAASNSDLLIGLDIQPTMAQGIYTGASPVAMRLFNPNTNAALDYGIQFRLQNTRTGQTGSDGFLISIDNQTIPNAYIYNYENASLIFGTNSTVNARLYPTGNVVIQNGGIFSDAGFRLDVNGTARVQGTFLSEVTANSFGFYTSKNNNHLTQNAYYDGLSWRSYGSSATLGSAILFQTDGINSNALNILTDTSISAANEALTFTSLLQLKTNGNLLINTTTDIASSKLTIQSTTQGFLPPRGTNTQMLAIASPVAGLMFYDTTNNKLNCYDGTTWQACW